MTTITYELTVTLLEDLHSGTGTGDMVIDAVQARDREGLPIIDRNHFRGVLRDNALRLKELDHFEESDIERLFGKGGGQARTLDCSSLRMVNNKDDSKESPFIAWESTARKPGSRCPEDHSLRRVEYVRADRVFKGHVTLTNPQRGDEALLEKLLKFTTRLGGNRTRGDGQIKIKLDKQDDTTLADSNLEAGTWLRLELKAMEALTIPTSGHAGNLIAGESHIPGRVFFAALCERANQEDPAQQDTLKQLFDSAIQVGNALPLPRSAEGEDPKTLTILPMPFHIHRWKPAAASAVATDLRWPHWAQKQAGDTQPLTPGKDVNLFQCNAEDKTQRPKGHLYLLRTTGGDWQRYQQPMEVRLRNFRGDPMDTTITRGETELFSEQRIPAGTCFLLDIHLPNNQGLTDKLAGWLKEGETFRLGRGKAPVKIVKTCEMEYPPGTQYSKTNGPDSLTLIATSDWIVRGFNLAPLSELNINTLLDQFNIEACNDVEMTLQAFQESEIQGSFNYATKLPRRPIQVIRRGSAFHFSGDNTCLAKLKEALEKCCCIGEGKREGYGQFIIDPDFPQLDEEASPVETVAPSEEPDVQVNEEDPS